MKLFYLAFAILFLLVVPAEAATYCVGPSATGSGSGADWSNLKAWSATPVRGDTWLLVDGSYSAKTLSVANSGTTLITIQKATVASHGGISTGWSDTLGDGVADFGKLTISSSYWTINGVNGNGASVVPADITTSNYGFYINPTTHPIELTGTASNITITHCRFFCTGVGNTGIYQTDVNQGTKSNITISYCLFDGFNEMIRNGADAWNGVVLEYSVILNSQGSAAAHGNAINAMYEPLDITIRYNVFKDMVGDGISGMISGNNSSIGPVLCYGNVFHNIPHCTYIIGANSGYAINNSRFYNNTVIHCNNDDAGFSICGRTTGSGNVGGNNLLYDLISDVYNSAWSGDYDAFYSCSQSEGAHKQVASGNPFVDLNGMDYRLVANTNPGQTLSSPYNVDPLGNTRGTWTRGAFEFVTAGGAGTVSFSTASQTVAENVGNAVVTINRSGGSTGAITVDMKTANGTATSGVDYTGVTNTVSFGDGVTTPQTVNIPIIDDGSTESGEDFTANLSNATGGATIGSPSTQTITITDNDSPIIALSVSSINFGDNKTSVNNDVSMTVTNTGSGTLSGTASTSSPFSVQSGGSYSLTNGQSQTVTVRYVSGTKGTNSGTLTFTGGGGATVALSGLSADILTSPITCTNMTVISPELVGTNAIYNSTDFQSSFSSSGRAVCYFTAASAGNYTIDGLVNAPGTTADSYWFAIDAEPTDPSNISDVIPITSGFESRAVNERGNGTFSAPQFAPKTWTLSAGDHKIVLRGREPMQIRSLTINAPTPPPTTLLPVKFTGLSIPGGKAQ